MTHAKPFCWWEQGPSIMHTLSDIVQGILILLVCCMSALLLTVLVPETCLPGCRKLIMPLRDLFCTNVVHTHNDA